MSFYDGIHVRLRGGIRRAGGKSSWGGGEGGASAAGIFGQADSFEIGHFGCGVRCRARDSSFEKSDSVRRKGEIVLRQTTIGLKNNCGEICSDTGGQDAHRYICGGGEVC